MACGYPDLNQPSLLRVSHHDFSAGLANHKFPEPSRQKYKNRKVEEKINMPFYEINRNEKLSFFSTADSAEKFFFMYYSAENEAARQQ